MLAALVRRRVFLRRAARRGHHDTFVLDDLSRIGVPVLVTLYAAARIALAIECVNVAFLLVRAVLLAALQPPSQHGAFLPMRGYTEPPRRIRLVA